MPIYAVYPGQRLLEAPKEAWKAEKEEFREGKEHYFLGFTRKWEKEEVFILVAIFLARW